MLTQHGNTLMKRQTLSSGRPAAHGGAGAIP